MSTSPSEISSTAGQQDAAQQSLNENFAALSTSPLEEKASENSKEEISSTAGQQDAAQQSLNENFAALSTSPLEEKASENSKEEADIVVQQESRPDANIEDMLETFNNAIARVNDRHSQNLTAVLTSTFKELAITIQNPNVSKRVAPKTDDLKQNYSQKMSKGVTPVTEKLNQNCSKNEAGKAFYDTSGKRGLLFILQLEDSQDWKTSNGNDLKVLTEFFKVTLGFDVRSYNTFSDLEAKQKKMSLHAKDYYCLMICISGHGNESGVITEWTFNEETNQRVVLKWETIGEIQKRFSNVTINSLSGVPKIILIDTCRGSVDNTTTFPEKNRKKADPLGPTTDSDSITIHATTHGFTANIPDKGSVGIQRVIEIFQKNWKKDHLEEMLIDARMNVADWGKPHERQILEIQTTLLKRLMFE